MRACHRFGFLSSWSIKLNDLLPKRYDIIGNKFTITFSNGFEYAYQKCNLADQCLGQRRRKCDSREQHENARGMRHGSDQGGRPATKPAHLKHNTYKLEQSRDKICFCPNIPGRMAVAMGGAQGQVVFTFGI
ncbi:MAG: hypothetical protein QGI29_01460 [Pirellulales bacterium]|jgi:hypothetical protein|nr:hypothetical protein [Pirellulales bacterium]